MCCPERPLAWFSQDQRGQVGPGNVLWVNAPAPVISPSSVPTRGEGRGRVTGLMRIFIKSESDSESKAGLFQILPNTVTSCFSEQSVETWGRLLRAKHCMRECRCVKCRCEIITRWKSPQGEVIQERQKTDPFLASNKEAEKIKGHPSFTAILLPVLLCTGQKKTGKGS